MKYRVVLTIEVPDGVSNDSNSGIIELCKVAFETLCQDTGINSDITLEECSKIIATKKPL